MLLASHKVAFRSLIPEPPVQAEIVLFVVCVVRVNPIIASLPVMSLN